MLENFDAPQQEAATPTYSSPFNGYIPVSLFPKHRKPKGKKKSKKALEKVEQERDRLLYMVGYLAAENEELKRGIALAVAASRRQLDDGLAENTLRLLSPKRKDKGL